ncbi:MAG: hypothetical protein ACR2JZ_01235, partial [Candidatus Limnocylindrales bacterium]
ASGLPLVRIGSSLREARPSLPHLVDEPVCDDVFHRRLADPASELNHVFLPVRSSCALIGTKVTAHSPHDYTRTPQPFLRPREFR